MQTFRALQQNMRNIAVGKNAEQSSTEGVAYAARAVDGVTKTSWHHNSCSSTQVGDDNKGTKNPWLLIDLEELYYIKELKLFNRYGMDCIDITPDSNCSKRLHDITISLLDQENNEVIKKKIAGLVGA